MAMVTDLAPHTKIVSRLVEMSLGKSYSGVPEVFLLLKGVELRKPCDEGIGGPLGLNGCSLQRPKMVSRSYILEIKLKRVHIDYELNFKYYR